ncbi:acyl-CoA thioesterase [Natronomonas pharaonis]|nr:acyl-CoA thioesterase [Natronomonas pharaonis]
MHDVYENTVRFAETDKQGIVFYGNYATYQDETFTAFMEVVGYPYEELKERGWDVHVVNLELSYRKPAEFREQLTNAMRASAIRDTSIEFDYECRNADGDLLVEGTVTHVTVDESGEPTRVPESFRDAIVEFQEEPPEPV